MVPVVLLAALSLTTQADVSNYTYYVNGAEVIITGYNCGSNTVAVIPDTIEGLPVTGIGDRAFADCGFLSGILIPDSVTGIADAAFSRCTALTEVTIPDSVVSIGGVVFYQCTALTNATIGAGVNHIGDGVFYRCTALESITAVAGNASFSDLDGVLCNGDYTVLVTYPAGLTGDYAVPNSVTNVGPSAFASCTHLTRVTIPESVGEIGNLAFFSCVNLTSVTVAAANPVYCDLDGVLYNVDKTMLITHPAGRAGSYVIPHGVTNIAGRAFAYSLDLDSIIVPDSVTSIGGSAFVWCYNMTSVYFSGAEPTIGGSAFDWSSPTVYYLAGSTGWDATFGGRPTAVYTWPQLMDLSATHPLTLDLMGTSNMTVVAEACTDLLDPSWVNVGTTTLSGATDTIIDTAWSNHPNRIYRVLPYQGP